MQAQHTEVSRQSPNLFSAEEVAKTIGADLKTVTDWLEVGAIDRAVFGGGHFSRYELHRAALVLELVKFGLSPSSAKDVIRDMEYDLQQIWARSPSSFKALSDINSNPQEVVGFLALEAINRSNRPTTPGRSYYSARFRHPGSRNR